MKFWKTLRKKTGNVLMPVIGTIAALTILAGSCVAFAVNSNRIVYKEKNMEGANEGRNILFVASQYLAKGLNARETDSNLKTELKNTFEFLEITRSLAEPYEYELWYPYDIKARKAVDSYEDYEGKWLKATVKNAPGGVDPDSNGNKDGEINSALFTEDAKLEELYNIGNMMTVYLTDEGMLPKRRYTLNKISLVESDIDTFDEGFTYMNQSGVIMIDDIMIALYGYITEGGVGTSAQFQPIGNSGEYEIVYSTGNLGGNYNWMTSDGSYRTTLKAYRQEYNRDSILGMLEHRYSTYSFEDDLDYLYLEEYDKHRIEISYTDTKTMMRHEKADFSYLSTQEFALDLSEYVFFENLEKLAIYLDSFRTKLNTKALAKVGVNSGNIDPDTIEWTDDSLTVKVVYKVNTNGNKTQTVYQLVTFSHTEFYNILKELGYVSTNNVLNKQKLYDDLFGASGTVTEIMNEYCYNLLESERKNSNKWNDLQNGGFNFGITDGTEITVTSEPYWDNNTNSFKYKPSVGKNELGDAIVRDVFNAVKEQYKLDPSAFRTVLGAQGDVVDFTEAEQSTVGGLKPIIRDNKILFEYRFYYFFKKDNGEINNTNAWISSDSSLAKCSEMTIDEFFRRYAREICASGLYGKKDAADNKEQEIIKDQENKDKIVADYKAKMVDLIGYNYIPNTTIQQILGGTEQEIRGLKEEAICNNLLKEYLAKNKGALASEIGSNNNYRVEIKKSYFNDESNFTSYNNMLFYTVEFDLIVGTETYNHSVDFMLQVLTKNYTNSYNSTTSSCPTNNNATKTDITPTVTESSKKQYEYLFAPVPVLSNTSSALASTNIANTLAVTSVIPYKARTNTSGVKYAENNRLVSINGEAYKKTTNLNDLKDVTENLFFDGSIENISDENFEIKVEPGASLYINGNLALNKNQKLTLQTYTDSLGKNTKSMLYINGNFSVFYEYTGYESAINNKKSGGKDVIIDGYIWDNQGTQGLITEMRDWYKAHGVDISANNCDIFINGDFDYRGYKARSWTNKQAPGWVQSILPGVDAKIITKLSESGKIFDQGSFVKNAVRPSDDQNKNYVHNPDECRSLLSGNFIINGDMRFRSWDELHNTESEDQTFARYSNAYSNPLINSTFYIDGVFDMTGLYTSSLYDLSRSNFVFAKSIKQPQIALNTTLEKGHQSDNYGAWSDTNGYLFMIVEDAINFSEVNFACVNLFTPYNLLLSAINDNKASETNFSSFVGRNEFTSMYPELSKLYPNKSVTHEWGLCSLLREGFDDMYQIDENINKIGVTDEKPDKSRDFK